MTPVPQANFSADGLRVKKYEQSTPEISSVGHLECAPVHWKSELSWRTARRYALSDGIQPVDSVRPFASK